MLHPLILRLITCVSTSLRPHLEFTCPIVFHLSRHSLLPPLDWTTKPSGHPPLFFFFLSSPPFSPSFLPSSRPAFPLLVLPWSRHPTAINCLCHIPTTTLLGSGPPSSLPPSRPPDISVVPHLASSAPLSEVTLSTSHPAIRKRNRGLVLSVVYCST